MCGLKMLEVVDFKALDEGKWQKLRKKLEKRQEALEKRAKEVSDKIDEMDEKFV